MFRFLIHSIIAQAIAIGIARATKDLYALTFYTTCTCLLIWNAVLAIVYLVVPQKNRQLSAFKWLFSATSAWFAPMILTIGLIFTPSGRLEAFLHFNR